VANMTYVILKGKWVVTLMLAGVTFLVGRAGRYVVLLDQRFAR
jgi:hypothetical protein